MKTREQTAGVVTIVVAGMIMVTAGCTSSDNDSSTFRRLYPVRGPVVLG